MTDGQFTGGLTYRVDAGRRPLLDLLRPVGASRAPVVLYGHGGGWHEGDRVAMPFSDRHLDVSRPRTGGTGTGWQD